MLRVSGSGLQDGKTMYIPEETELLTYQSKQYSVGQIHTGGHGDVGREKERNLRGNDYSPLHLHL